MCQARLKLSWKVNECEPLLMGTPRVRHTVAGMGAGNPGPAHSTLRGRNSESRGRPRSRGTGRPRLVFEAGPHNAPASQLD